MHWFGEKRKHFLTSQPTTKKEEKPKNVPNFISAAKPSLKKMSFNNTCSDHHGKAISPANPHFFIPILPASAHQEFLVPKSFLKHLSLGVRKKKKQKCEDLKAILRSNGHGKSWVVKVTAVNDDGDEKELKVKRACFDLQDPSWKDFTLHQELHVGDILVFRHIGSLSFEVIVLDSTACEKEFPPLLDHPFFGQHDKSEEEQTEDYKDAAAARRSSCLKSPARRKFIVTIKRRNLASCVLSIPRDFAKSNGLEGKMCTVTLRDREERRSWQVNLRYYVNNGYSYAYLSGGWSAFAKAKGLKEGNVCSFELIMKSSAANSTKTDNSITFDFAVLTSTAAPPPPPPPGQRSSTTFVTTLKPCNVKPRYILYLPHTFAKCNGLYKKTCVIMLRDREKGTLWRVNLSYHENRGCCQAYICGGWAAFAKAMGLKEGNVCSFEPSATAASNAIIFDFAVLNSSTTCYKETKPLDYHQHQIFAGQSSDRKSVNVTSPRVKVVDADADAAAGTSFSPSQSRFITALKYYNFSQFTLGIPIEFARSNGLTEKVSTITVRDEEGKPWSMLLRYKKGQQKVLIQGGGWRAFCLGKGLKEGDICSFELIKSSKRTKMNKIVFDFRISRC